METFGGIERRFAPNPRLKIPLNWRGFGRGQGTARESRFPLLPSFILQSINLGRPRQQKTTSNLMQLLCTLHGGLCCRHSSSMSMSTQLHTVFFLHKKEIDPRDFVYSSSFLYHTNICICTMYIQMKQLLHPIFM